MLTSIPRVEFVKYTNGDEKITEGFKSILTCLNLLNEKNVKHITVCLLN